MEEILALLAAVLPGEALSLIQDNIRTLVTTQHGGLRSDHYGHPWAGPGAAHAEWAFAEKVVQL